MSGHTKGPWVVSAKGIGGATVSEDVNRKNHIACLVNKEDAHLIAAAPELLEALELALDAIKWWENEHSCCAGATDDSIEKISSAIAKAKGENQ
ncbi:MAG: hypothetical protein GOVbin4685_39 [Prokaryotic dsDNA virus sp.]|jgi:hypothetical protein|nr:MAG: hypothetical protein GOVbin4685_39 [Prokaryotic dsDNA virus sp.]|tara:strand:- start:3299 stop:3580 length:282 start_codon:yes stop_codon:yes gene_type:complete